MCSVMQTEKLEVICHMEAVLFSFIAHMKVLRCQQHRTIYNLLSDIMMGPTNFG